MKASRIAAIAPLALALGAASAGAQGKCEINTDKGVLKDAQVSLTKAEFGKQEERQVSVRKAVTLLTENPGKINNEVARNYLLAQGLGWWIAKGGVAPVVERSSVGLSGSGSVDLAAALDSAVRAVEKGAPACAAEAEGLRRQAWAPVITAAGNFINASKLDSAKTYVERAQVIFPQSPYTWYYSAVVYQNSQDFDKASQAYQKTRDLVTPALAQSDTSLVTLQRQAAYNAAYLALVASDKAPEAEKGARMQEAATAFRAYLEKYPNGENVAEARSGLARALQASGDTTAVNKMFAEMLAAPASFTDMQLFEAGTNAFNANRREDAAKLFEAGLQKNVAYRDALYNLTNTYMALQDGPKMLASARKLVQVDPNSPDNWRLLAAAHQLPGKKIETEFNAVRKDPKKAARAAELRKQMQALNDSVLTYYTKFEKSPARVTVTGFRHDGAKHTLSGTVENLSEAPANYALKVEFLDAQGNVVATGDAPLAVAPKEKKDFRVEVQGTGIVAWRYAPIA